MSSRQPSLASRSSGRSVVAGVVATLVLAVGLGACGDGDTGLSELAQQGKNTAMANGCASCHGAQGQGGVGPSWVDLAGSERELVDGTTVVADDDYLIRSILEPDAQKVAGYTIAMPTNGVSEAGAADIVTYIKELTSDEA